MRRIDNVLIHLVGDDVDVVLFSKARNQLQLRAGKRLTAGVGRVAQDQRLRVLAEGILQHLGVNRTAHVVGLLRSQCLAEVLRTPGNGILVEAFVGDLG